MLLPHDSRVFGTIVLFILHVWMISNWNARFESTQFAFLTEGNSAKSFDHFHTRLQIIGSRMSYLAILLIDLICTVYLFRWANVIPKTK